MYAQAEAPVRYLFGRADFPVGAQPQAVVTADVNADGKLDLVVANSGSATVSVLFGKPDGTFGPKSDFGVGANPSSVAIGDFNGDGKLDIVVANTGTNTYSILLGSTNGTFQNHVDYPGPLQPSSVATADFNGDGKLDLAITSRASNIVSVFLGRGDGTFGLQTNYPTGNTPVHLIATDVNSDRKPDLVVANWGGDSVSVLIGVGDGTFGTDIEYPAGSQPMAVAAAPLGSTGRIGLAVANSGSNTISILPGTGDGYFLSKIDYATSDGPAGITAGDFNLDGLIDVAVTCQSTGTISVLTGKQDGTFNPHAEYASGILSGAVISADFTGDGRSDLAIVNSGANSVSVLLGEGDGRFCPRVDFPVGSFPYLLTTGDYNRDGIADIAITGAFSNTVNVFAGDGTGSFQALAPFFMPPTISFTTADVNGDGNPDVIATTGAYINYVLTVATGNGDGTFAAKSSVPTCFDTWQTAIGDFNGDMKQDAVVVCHNDNTVTLHLGRGDGTFQAGQSFGTGTSPEAIVTGDFNNDGKLDAVVVNNSCSNANCDGTISVLLGNGNGTLQAKRDFASGSGSDAIVSGDFNRDGKLDVAVANNNCQSEIRLLCGPGTVSVFLGRGDGTFNPRVDYGVNTAPGAPGGRGATSMATVDLNRDGNLDIAVETGLWNGSSGPSTFSVLLGNGDGTFQPRLDFASPGQQLALTSNDFNSDGAPDVAVTNYGMDTASIFSSSPVAALFPSSLVFGSVAVGLNTSPKKITLTNSGTAPLKLTTISISGDFSQTNDCAAVLDPGRTCLVQVAFLPRGLGLRTGRIIYSDNAAGASQSLPLSGTGVSSTPVAVTITTAPSGLSTTIDGSPYLNTFTGSWLPGSSHTVAATSPQAQYSFRAWSDGGAQAHSVTGPAVSSTLTATFDAPVSSPPFNVGIFRQGFFWLLDVDRDHQFSSPPDRAFAFGGVPGDIPITGDWNGNGQTKVGVFRPSNGLFILDSNGNGQFDAGDAVYNLGVGTLQGDAPVVGDWNGDGRTKVGLFRQGFFWILDYNGNGAFEQGVDRTYAFGGVAGDVPVVGDWTGTGKSRIGVVRQGFFWILDINGNGSFDGPGLGQDLAFPFGGLPGDVPVVGDWNGDGTSKAGVFRAGFFWVLDANGNHQFDGNGPGQDLSFAFGGITGDRPVVGKW